MSFSVPMYLDAAGNATLLERVKLSDRTDEGQFLEAWLQELLLAHPQIIPFRDIDPSLGSVIPVCRELSTPAGPIDLLFVTTAGKIVLVETKLYRNPEARREVVGQILDYAKELTSWRYEQLAAKVASATRKGSSHLLDLVRGSEPDIDDARFVDSINRSLSRADMTLLIIGDGIQSGAESLVGFLEKHGGLQFSFGLVEVAVFRGPDGGKYIQPRVLAKTELMRRTLLVSPDGTSVQDSLPESRVDVDIEPTWQQLFWTEFLQALRLDDLTQPTPPKPPRGTNVYFPMPPSGNVAWVSAFVAESRKQVGVYLVLSASYEPFKGIFSALHAQAEEINAEIGALVSWDSGAKSYTVTTRLDYANLNAADERRAVILFLTVMTNKFVNSFRPRLAALLRDA